MAHEFLVTLSDVELRAMEYVAVDVNHWIQNAIHERCRLAAEELVADTIRDNLSRGIPISGTQDEIVMSSTLPNASQRHEEAMNKMLAGIANTQINS